MTYDKYELYYFFFSQMKQFQPFSQPMKIYYIFLGIADDTSSGGGGDAGSVVGGRKLTLKITFGILAAKINCGEMN